MLTIHRLPKLALFAALAAGPTLEAAEWVAEPSINLRGEFDDNIRLTSARHDEVWGMTLDPRLMLSRRSELLDLSVMGRLRASQYPSEDSLNTVDNFFDLAATRRLERGSVNASVSLINDTTLQDETLDFDTGLTINQIDRSERSLTLGGEYMFNEATWLEASVSMTTLDYDDGERYGYLDYDYLTPGLRIVHQFDPQTQVFGILSHAKVEYDGDTELESKTDSLQLGAAYDITETWKVSASVGSRRTRTSSLTPTLVAPIPGLEPFCGFFFECQIVYVPTDSESTGLVYDATLTREFETGSLRLSASQSVTPSSTGTDTESTRVSLDGTHRFDAKLSAGLAVSYYQSSTVGDVTTNADNDRYRVAPSLTWRLDEDMALTTGYSYTRVKRGSAGDDNVDSNAVFISLGYTWPRMAMSR